MKLLLAACFGTLISCGSSAASTDDAGSDAATKTNDGSTNTWPDASTSTDAGDASTSNPCNCAAGEGCVHLTITRDPDDSQFPWKQWPQSDGKGTLIVSAYHSTSKKIAQQRIANADITSASATFQVSLECATAGDNFIGAYLDDNGNASSAVTFATAQSADYIDTCSTERNKHITVPAGTVIEAAITLSGTCD